jgi:hypothetical protein
MFDDAISRAYYEMFYGPKALLIRFTARVHKLKLRLCRGILPFLKKILFPGCLRLSVCCNNGWKSMRARSGQSWFWVDTKRKHWISGKQLIPKSMASNWEVKAQQHGAHDICDLAPLLSLG